MKKESIKQALKFGTVGVFNTLVDYGIFYVFIAFLHVDKSISQVFATAVAMCGSYLINRRWTYGEKGIGKKRQIAKFIVTNIVAMLSTIIFMNLLHDVLKFHILANNIFSAMKLSLVLNDDMSVMLCKIAASVISMLINFLGNKFWVFTK